MTGAADIDRALAAAEPGAASTPAEALALAAAARISRRFRRSPSGSASPATARASPFSKKVFIPLTQLCRDVCHYCTFAQPPRKRRAAYLSPDDVLGDRARGPGRRLQGGAVHARRQAGAALRRGARGARSARLRDARSTISTPSARAGAQGDRPAAASQSRRDDAARTSTRLRAGLGLAGHHAGDGLGAAVAARRPAFRLARQGARACASRRSRRPGERACRSPPAS